MDRSHRQKPCIKCGRKTEANNGICAICKLFPKDDVDVIKDLPEIPVRKEKKAVPRKKYQKACEHFGCEKYQWKEKLCMVHYKQKHGLRVGRGKGRKNDPTPLSPAQREKRPIDIKPIDTSRPIEPQLERYREADENKTTVSQLDLIDISVDLYLYPALRQWLFTGVDVIDPVQLLSVLIKPRLDELNSKIDRAMVHDQAN